MARSKETHRGAAALTHPAITPERIERAVAEGRRLQAAAVRQAIAGIFRGARSLLRRGFFPARVEQRLGGAAAGCG